VIEAYLSILKCLIASIDRYLCDFVVTVYRILLGFNDGIVAHQFGHDIHI